MKFGLYTQTKNPDDSSVYADLIDNVREQVVLCDQSGFDIVYPDEHHFRVGYTVTTNPLMAGAMLAAHTSRIRIGPVLLPANWQPLRLAEDIAYLDHLSRGRAEVILGRGISRHAIANLNPQLIEFWPVMKQDSKALTYAKHIKSEDANAAQAASREHFAEVVEIMKKGWAEEPFSHEGRYYKFPLPGLPWEGPRAPDPTEAKDGEIVKMSLSPKPYQKPHPPLRMLVHSESSYKEAARLGMKAMLWVNPVGLLRERLETYAQVRTEREGRKFAVGEDVAALKLCYVAPTYEEAKRDADHLFTPMLTRFVVGAPSTYWLDEGEGTPEDTDWEFWRKHLMIIAGSPEQVAEQVHELDERYDLDTLATWTQAGAGNLTHKQTMRSLDLFATKVLPLFADGKSESRGRASVAVASP